MGISCLTRQFTNTDPNTGEVLRGMCRLKEQKAKRIRPCQAVISVGRAGPQTNPGLQLIAVHIYSAIKGTD